MKTASFLICLAVFLGSASRLLAATNPQRAKDIVIVVHDFEVLTPNVNKDLARTVPEILRNKIGHHNRVRVLERRQMAKLFYDNTNGQKLPEIYAPFAASRVGKILTANYSILGSISKVGDSIIISAQIVDNETSVQTSGDEITWRPEEDLRRVLETLSQRLLSFLPDQQPQEKRRANPTNLSQPADRKASSVNSGYLYLTITPSDCRVRVDGSEYIADPPQKKELPPGKYIVHIIPNQEIYNSADINIEIKPKKTTNLSIELTKKRTRLAIKTEIPKAAIYLDDTYVTDLPSKLGETDAGPHELTVLTPRGTVVAQKIFAHPDTLNEIQLDPTAYNEQEIPTYLFQQGEISRDPTNISVFGNIVIIKDQQGFVEAFDSYTLQRRWRFTSYEVVDKPILIGSSIFVLGRFTETHGGPAASTDTYHLAIEIDALTGKMLSKGKPIASDSAKTLSDDSTVIYIFDNREIRILNTKTMELPPVHLEAGPKEEEGFDWTRASISGDQLFVLSRNRELLYAFKLAGTFTWKRYLRYAADQLIACNSIVAIEGDQEMLSVDRETGTSQWSQPLDGIPIRLFQCQVDKLLLLDETGGYRVFDAVEGSASEHRLPLSPSSKIVASITDPLGRLLVATTDRRLSLYDPDLSIFMWSRTTTQISTILAVGTGYIAATGNRGEISLFTLSTRRNFLGWIESVDTVAKTLNVRTSISAIRSEPLSIVDIKTFTHPDYLNLRARHFPTLVIESHLAGPDLSVASANDPKAVTIGGVVTYLASISIQDPTERALVWIDDSFEGKGTRKILWLPPGPHHVFALGPQKKIFDRMVEIKPNSDTAIDLTMADSTEVVGNILTTPAGAKVYVDDRLEGTTPITLRDLTPDQPLRLRIENFGFRSIKDHLILSSGSSDHRYTLQASDYWLRIFAFSGASRNTAIIGWPVDSIQTDGVTGTPAHDARDRYFIGATIDLEYPLRRITPFGSIQFNSTQGGGSHEIGFRIFTGRHPYIGDLHLGLSGVWLSGTGSTPPNKGFKEDRSAPLEDWHHPIPGVFVKNSDPRYLAIQFRARPRTLAFAQLDIGSLIDSNLKGSRLVRNEAGHLVKDPSHAYSVKARDGFFLDASLHLPLRWLVPLRWLSLSVAIRADYRYSTTDFGITSEKISSFNLGIGVVSFKK